MLIVVILQQDPLLSLSDVISVKTRIQTSESLGLINVHICETCELDARLRGHDIYMARCSPSANLSGRFLTAYVPLGVVIPAQAGIQTAASFK